MWRHPLSVAFDSGFTQEIGDEAQGVDEFGRVATVYWANDLFLRQVLSLAVDMAKSGRTLTPRTDRYGHSRATLSAARRTFASSRQARVANLLD
jgi:hypothetical protein